MFIIFADFIFKSVFINLKVTHLEWYFFIIGHYFYIVLLSLPRFLFVVKKFKFLVNASCMLTKNKQELVNTGLVKIMFNHTLFCLHFFTKPDSKCTFGCSHYAKHFWLWFSFSKELRIYLPAIAICNTPQYWPICTA